MEQELVLSKEKSVRRVGNLVLRPAAPWSPNRLAFLRFLRERGLPVEEMLGIQEGQERYAYVEGEMVHPNRWSDQALFAVGQLTAELHRLGAEFRPERDLGCAPWCLRELGGGERIWCHGDMAPWNMITRDGLPLCLVDWEFAGPLDPMVELARVCWLFPQLVDDDLAERYELPSPEGRARQVRLVCEGYGLEKARRGTLTRRILEVILCETAHEAIDPGVAFEDEGPLWGFAWRTRSAYWVWRHQAVLERAME